MSFGIDQELDRRDSTSRRSPHATVQEYLNRSDALWGITTNGRSLRLLRNIARLSKPTYLEFDLDGMIAGNLYSEFVLLYRLLHVSRFPSETISAHECLLERYYQQGIDEGSRVREKLRDGVEEALRTLGTAFLSHAGSERLRHRFQTGELDASGYYRQLLRLVYRFLFLMASEERRLLFPTGEDGKHRQALYTKYYSISVLRNRADRYLTEDHHTDLWLGLRETFRMLRDNEAASLFGLSALNGELFSSLACPDLEGAVCTNRELLSAIRELSTFRDEGGQRRRVNYAGLDVEEFGSVYESLLDFHPQVTLQPPAFDLVAGSERKQTGSYYTPPELVHELIESALVPVMEDRLRSLKTREEREAALLGLRVCDPASGSGHFLLAAGRRIARELATVRSGEQEPSPEEYRHALRDVIRTCIYAVDKNPLAVDLCKVALWIEGHSAGLPLSFLDHHIKCGDSLVGLANLKVLDEGIPDEAYRPVTGDDKKAAAYYKRRNQEERKRERQLSLGESKAIAEMPEALAEEFQTLATLEEHTPDDVLAKEGLYSSLRQQGTDWWRLKVACDLWTAAFFLPLQQEDALHMEGVPTTGTLRKYLQTNAIYGPLLGQAVATSQNHPFFHWPLEFPDVSERGGFDVVLGNPPWDMMEMSEVEFFSAKAPDIASAPTARKRGQMIAALQESNPVLHAEFIDAKRSVYASRHFIQKSGRFPLSSLGRINLYPLFVETVTSIISSRGRAGVIVPSAISMDAYNVPLFKWLVQTRSLASLFDFENRGIFFPDVHGQYRFCLLTVSGKDIANNTFGFCYFCHDVAELKDQSRRISLEPDEIAPFSPNTLSPPVLTSLRDVGLTRAGYIYAGVLFDRSCESNPWGVSIQRMLSLSDPGDLFRRITDLDDAMPATSSDSWVPLYSGKAIHQYDHQFSTCSSSGDWRELTIEERGNPTTRITTEYYARSNEVSKRLQDKQPNDWLLVYRDVTNATNERTVIAAIIPNAGCDTTCRNIFSTIQPISKLAYLLTNLNSMPLDYFARQKVIGTHLNATVLEQLPLLPPVSYDSTCMWFPSVSVAQWLMPRVMELSYTAWDLKPFARDCDYEGPPFRWDSERRFLLRCELDAAFFHLYHIDHGDVDYIMDTFPIVKRKDEENYGEYRTKRTILEIYDEMAQAIRTGQPYSTRLNPPPADPRVTHPQDKEAS